MKAQQGSIINRILTPQKPWSIYLFSATALLILAYFSVGYYHPDEHFQILEFAAWKLHLTSPDELPWEFHFQMRPSIQPAMVVAIHNIFSLFGCSNPFSIAFFLRILSAAISFTAMWMIYQRYAEEIRGKIFQKWFLFLSFLLWFALYNNIRFTSETWSGSIFIVGFSYLFLKKRKLNRCDYFITGILTGLSFVFRFQAGLLIAGFFFWLVFIKKDESRLIAFMTFGIIVSFLTGVIIDRWFYGEWTITAWNYFQQNIIADKISGFGIQPWWFYFEDIFIRAVPPFSLIFIISFLLILLFLRKDVLTWTLLPFVLFHFLIGHKETRFFYPLIGFLPILLIKACEFLHDHLKGNLSANKYFMGFAKIFGYSNVLMIFIVFFNPADSQVNLYKKIYNQYPGPITLYYINENPFERAKEINYYKRGSLIIRKAESPGKPESVPGKKYLIAIRSKDPEIALFDKNKLVYSSYPEWIKRFNFNHWLDRTKFWYLFEVVN